MPDKLFQTLYQTRNPFKKVLYYLLSYLVRLFQLVKVRNHDIIFIQQGLSYFGPPVLERLLAKLNPNIIFDTDDAHFTKPAFATGFAARFHDRERMAKLCKLACEVIVSVTFISDYAKRYNPNVTVIPTSIDLANYQLKEYKADVTSRVVIGWAGTASGLMYLRRLTPVLQRLAETHDILLKIICSEFIEIDSVEIHQQKWSLENEIANLQSLDIGIMPLANTAFERGKGGFKLIQYMGVGVPVVCSPIGVNVNLVQDGANGFLANSPDEWFDKLLQLIESPFLREYFGRKGRESIEGRFTTEANAEKLMDVLQKAMKKRSARQIK